MNSGAPTDPVAAHAAAVEAKRGQAIVIWTVGMFCIFGWEWICCLPAEYRRIWKKKITFASALYLVNRYYGLLQFSIVVSLLVNAWSVETCNNHIFRWQPVGAMISTIISQTILSIRIYALYSRSKAIVAGLGLIMLAEVGVMAYVQTVVFPVPSPAPGVLVPCVAVGPTEWLTAFWSLPLGFDTVAFVLTGWKSYTFWRQEIETPMLTILFRDGLIYFAAIFSMNLVNVSLFVTQPASLQAINLPATLMLTIIMSCRLVLNVRSSEARGQAPNSSIIGWTKGSGAPGGYSGAGRPPRLAPPALGPGSLGSTMVIAPRPSMTSSSITGSTASSPGYQHQAHGGAPPVPSKNVGLTSVDSDETGNTTRFDEMPDEEKYVGMESVDERGVYVVDMGGERRAAHQMHARTPTSASSGMRI